MEYNKSRYNPKIHHRRSIRLKGYDYSQAGLYFITICCQNRICRFGEIVIANNATMILNDAGKMVDDEWLALVERFPNIVLHEYIIMPNHFHCILEIVSNNTQIVGANIVNTQTGQNGIIETEIRRPQGYAPTVDGVQKNKNIGDMMDAFKSITTVKYIDGVKNCGWNRFDGKIWQRDYFEHIIRNDESYLRISEYIKNNPAKWKDDKFYSK